VLVATTRALDAIAGSGVRLDALVGSATDPREAVPPGGLTPAPRFTVLTRGAQGGTWTAGDGSTGTWAPEPLPGPAVDAYGCGDAFAAGLTYGLGAGMAIGDAVRLGARCGARCMTGRGPYGAQLERLQPGGGYPP
jgi:ribokinase